MYPRADLEHQRVARRRALVEARGQQDLRLELDRPAPERAQPGPRGARLPLSSNAHLNVLNGSYDRMCL
jgi:hypothetical protein